jgi:hypothetical protein
MMFNDHKNVSIGLQFNQRKVSVSATALAEAEAKRKGKTDAGDGKEQV